MASPKTESILAEMIKSAKIGHDIIPMFFQPRNGTSNSVSAAIRVGLSRGLLFESGKDGCGKPKYQITVPAANHTGNGAVN